MSYSMGRLKAKIFRWFVMNWRLSELLQVRFLNFQEKAPLLSVNDWNIWILLHIFNIGFYDVVIIQSDRHFTCRISAVWLNFDGPGLHIVGHTSAMGCSVTIHGPIERGRQRLRTQGTTPKKSPLISIPSASRERYGPSSWSNFSYTCHALYIIEKNYLPT